MEYLDLLDGLLARQHAGDGEEAGLHDRVDAPAHAAGLGDLVASMTKNFSFFAIKASCTARQMVPDSPWPIAGS